MSKTAQERPESPLDSASVSVSADRALDALTQAGERAEALVEAWIRTGNAAAVHEVAERGSGKGRKAARRGLNVLKARGVEIPAGGGVVRFGGPQQKATEEAWLIAPDGGGTSLIAITARTPTSRCRTVFAFLNPSVGVYRVSCGDLSQSQLKESLSRAAPGAAYKPVAVPVDWARRQIADARRLQKERNIPEPLGFSGSEALLEPVPASPVPHPLDAEGLELVDDDAKALSEKSAGLHRLPEFGGWLPSKAAVDELLAKVGETLNPDEEADPKVVQERLGDEIAAATDRYFTPERRTELVRMMKDSALSVLAREGEERALEVVATMAAIERRGLITDPPRDLAFLRAFFDKAIAVLVSQTGGQLRIPVARRETG